MLRNNPKNPYGTQHYVWQVVACTYCQAPAGRGCVVVGKNRLAQNLHQGRRAKRDAAYDAWEQGHQQGLIDAVAAVQRTLDFIPEVAPMLKAAQ
jgi:hypothetical protein